MADETQSGLTPEDEAAQAILCQLVGSCLAIFSKIEESLAALYGTAAGIPRMEVAFQSHDAVREFQYRLDMTNAAVRFWIKSLSDLKAKSDAEAEWITLCGLIKEDSKDRNKLAHFALKAADGPDGKVLWYVCPYFQLYSHEIDAHVRKSKVVIPDGVRKFDADSLASKGVRFDAHRKRIDQFIGRLRVLGAPLPKWSARPDGATDGGVPPMESPKKPEPQLPPSGQ